MQVNISNEYSDAHAFQIKKECSNSRIVPNEKIADEGNEQFFELNHRTCKEDAMDPTVDSLHTNNYAHPVMGVTEKKEDVKNEKGEETTILNNGKENMNSTMKNNEEEVKKKNETKENEGKNYQTNKEDIQCAENDDKNDGRNNSINEANASKVIDSKNPANGETSHNEIICVVETIVENSNNLTENATTRNTENPNELSNDVRSVNSNDTFENVTYNVGSFVLEEEYNLSSRTSRNLHICSFFIHFIYIIMVLILIGKLSFDFSAKSANKYAFYMKCLCGFLLITLLTHMCVRIYYSYTFIKKLDIPKHLKRFENYFHGFAIIFSLICFYFYLFHSEKYPMNDTFLKTIILSLVYYFTSVALFIVLHIVLLIFLIIMLIIKKKSPTPKRVLKKLKIMTYGEYRKFCQDKKYMDSSYFWNNKEELKKGGEEDEAETKEKEKEKEKEEVHNKENNHLSQLKEETVTNVIVGDNTKSNTKENNQKHSIPKEKTCEDKADYPVNLSEKKKNDNEIIISNKLDEILIVPNKEAQGEKELQTDEIKQICVYKESECKPINTYVQEESIAIRNDITNNEPNALKKELDVNDSIPANSNSQSNNNNKDYNKDSNNNINKERENEHTELRGIYNFICRKMNKGKQKKNEKKKSEIYEENNSLYISIDNPDFICSVCCIEYANDDVICVLPCNYLHYFHKNCIFTWLKKNTECPFCRENIKDFFKRRKKKIKKRKEQETPT